MKINGKDYDISPLDTKDTIRNMIAAKEGVFPQYIRFTTFTQNKIEIELLPEILSDVDISQLQATVEQLVKDWGLKDSDIVLEWMRVDTGAPLDPRTDVYAPVFKRINPTDFYSVDGVNQRYSYYMQRLQASINRLAGIVEEEATFKEELEQAEPVETTNFIQDSVIIDYEITIDTDPLETFDNITVNNTIPYVHLNFGGQSYYKILESMIPDNDWLDEKNTLTFKINVDEWGTASLNYTETNAPYKAVLTLESKVGKDSNEEYLKNAILEILGDTEVQVEGRKEMGIKGVFAMPELSLDRAVFLDLITNNKIISHFIYVDETRELSSEKKVLYIYWATDPDSEDVITAFLSEKVVGRTDPFHINKELPLFTPYLNVRISRALNLAEINCFKDAFAIIISMYLKEYRKIVNIYNSVIPGFKNEHVLVRKTAVIDKQLKALQMQDPELFIHGYPTNCEKKKQPQPIKEGDVSKWKRQGKQVMNYPKGSNNYYVCNNENEFMYPGLMKNKLSNNDVYPYLPCCYPLDQTKGGKLLSLYLKDEVKESSSKTTNIVQRKIVGRNKFGLLPRNVNYILQKKSGEYLRQGVQQGPNAFIEVLLLALDPDYEKLNDDDKDEYVLNFRRSLTKACKSSTIAQLYDMDEKTLIKNILDEKIPFDSKLYIGLLEAHYKVQIVVFERSDSAPNGEYEIPRYTQGYLYRKLDPSVRTVLIYKHLGIRSDNLEIPHYELIIERKSNGVKQSFTGDIIRNVYSYFLKTYRLYAIGEGRYKAVALPPISDPRGQIVDKYGKCRGYLMEDNIVVMTSPLEPINIDIVDMPKERVRWGVVSRFIRNRGLRVSMQDIVNNKAIGVVIDLNNIAYAYIPFLPHEPIPDIPEATNVGFSTPIEDGVLDKTIKNRKIANFLMQLVLYSFSRWYEGEPKLDGMSVAKANVALQEFLNQSVNKFIRNKITVEEGHEYDLDKLPRKLTLNSDFFRNGRLIVDSQRTFSNLSYYLKFMVNKSISIVEDYKNNIFLQNYYTYADDFIQRKNELVFIGSLGLTNWVSVQQHGISNAVHKIPHLEIQKPYFFAHWALNGGKPVIMQNVKGGSLSRALAVSKNFVDNGINTGFDTAGIGDVDKSVFYLENGELKRTGSGRYYLWYFGKNVYAAILRP